MQNHNHSSPPPESPRSVLPPLSKYYYGPAQGRASPQRVALDDNRGGTSLATAAPPLPPRQPPNTESSSASQWMNHFASTEQLWQLPGPPTSAPPASQSASAAYNPNTYGPMPGHRPNPKAAGTVEPGGSTWGEGHDNYQAQATGQMSKPPLPPRPHAFAAEALGQQSPSEGHAHKEYLPSLSYNPRVEHSTFNHRPATPNSISNDQFSPLPPHRLPPAPPPKLPSDNEGQERQASEETRRNVPSSPTLQMYQYPSLSHQEQSPNLRHFDPNKDHVTYSIPSSIWRQDQVSHFMEPSATQPDSNNEPQRSDSFYWQSPHSSIHSTKDEDGDIGATVASQDALVQKQSASESDNQRKDSDTIVTSSLLSRSTLGTYGASALGFGGPSDWEHFGDYEAEEIDDTELYIRPKPPVKRMGDPESVELPASSLSDRDVHTTRQSTNTHRDAHPPAPAQNHEGTTLGKAQKASIVEEGPNSGQAADVIEPERNLGSALNGMLKAAKYEIQPAEVKVTCPALDASEGDALATDLDETIQAWSRASSKENLKDGKSAEPGIERPIESLHEQQPVADTLQPDTSAQIISSPTDSNSGVPSNVLDESLEPKQDTAIIKTGSFAGLQAPSKHDSTISSAPTEAEQPTNGEPASASQDMPDESKETSHVQPTVVESPGPSAKAQTTDNPYAGLDAWGKASLNRYIAMLREESGAQTDKDKLNIFTVFTSRETRLRAVLYGAESEQLSVQPASAQSGSVKRASTTAFKRASKALPALPGEDSRQVSSQENGHAKKTSVKLSAATILGAPKPKPTPLLALDITKAPFPEDVEESPSGVQFSPGGRPIVPRATNIDRMSYTSEPESFAVATRDRNLDKENAGDLPMPFSTEHQQFQEGQGAAVDTSTFKLFKHTEDRSEAHDYAANRQSKRQSQFRPYAAKTMGSDEYREMFLAETPNTASVNGTELAQQLRQADSKPDEQASPDLRRFVRADFDPLLSVLPESGEIHSETIQLSDLRQVTDAVPDDFSFIHQSVVVWDGKARRQREFNERERHARQIESEQKIDALFDDHEIGYGDISELESGFKRSEAARKTDEDRSEYKTFVAEVFNVVWARLHYEIDQLNPHYVKYTEILNNSTAGKDMFDPSGSRLALAPTMDALLTLHQKLEIRHQKAFEAVLERDRRLKKTELSPWYSLGNVAKMKQLEKQFEGAEKKAIVEYCRQRDIRANNLMDVLDQNTLRGVGANQDYMEMVMKAVRRIASGRAFASQPGGGEPGVGLEEVTKAKSVTKALATSSEQIVQTFHVADMLLNAADYEFSAAKAKLSGADAITFQTLNEERAKEDQKLMRDLEHRLALIREDSRRTNDEIVKLLLFLGVQNGHAGISPTVPQATHAGHEERLHRALEEAKRRNALKESGVTPVLS